MHQRIESAIQNTLSRFTTFVGVPAGPCILTAESTVSQIEMSRYEDTLIVHLPQTLIQKKLTQRPLWLREILLCWHQLSQFDKIGRKDDAKIPLSIDEEWIQRETLIADFFRQEFACGEEEFMLQFAQSRSAIDQAMELRKLLGATLSIYDLFATGKQTLYFPDLETEQQQSGSVSCRKVKDGKTTQIFGILPLNILRMLQKLCRKTSGDCETFLRTTKAAYILFKQELSNQELCYPS